MKKAIALIPGLGLDCRIMERLELEADQQQCIDWIVPESLEETIDAYAGRMAQLISSDDPPVLIGHSFGGMIAQHIAAHRPVRAVILISSLRSPAENPFFFKMVAPIGLDRFFNRDLALNSFDYWGKYHGYETAESQALFRDMVKNQHDLFLRWGLRQVSTWEGAGELSCPVIQIHGDRDYTFPIRWIKQVDHQIKSGTHLLVYNKPRQVSQIISKIITALPD